MRCLFATHLFLDTSRQRDNHFLLFDWLLAYTNGLESLYLLESDKNKSDNLGARVAVVLGQNEEDENRLHNIVKQFYKVIRSDLTAEETRQLLSGPGVQYVLENVGHGN